MPLQNPFILYNLNCRLRKTMAWGSWGPSSQKKTIICSGIDSRCWACVSTAHVVAIHMAVSAPFLDAIDTCSAGGEKSYLDWLPRQFLLLSLLYLRRYSDWLHVYLMTLNGLILDFISCIRYPATLASPPFLRLSKQEFATTETKDLSHTP